MRILIINGPNLNLLGRREPGIYGATSFADYLGQLRAAYPQVTIDYYQSNHEGDLIDRLHAAGYPEPDTDEAGRPLPTAPTDGVILNAGAYTHTSVALADAIRAIPVPVVEVHISNVHQREEFRRQSYISPAAAGIVVGFGLDGYRLALEGLIGKVKGEK